jgi:hypothetical protein
MVALSAEVVGVRAEQLQQPSLAPTPGEEPSVEVENMATSEERMRILRMIEQGKISAEEGARLLAAMGGPSGPRPQSPPNPSGGSRMFRVRVSDPLTGRQKVNVNIPVGLANIALRFVPEASGIDIDEIRQALAGGFSGRIIDVTDDDDGNHVEIFIE